MRVMALVFAANAVVACAAVRAQDNFKMLGEREVRAKVVGKDITDGSHWSIYVRPDGALVGAESGSRWTGTWNIQRSKLCMSNPGSTALDCYDVWMSGQNISLRLKKDDDSFTGVIERHKSN
jgi:heat shock protein HslJ